MEDNRIKLGQRVSTIGLILNIFLAASKIATGLLFGMISILADGINNFSDAAASVISLVGFRLSAKPADDEHPFGHARYEYISALGIAALVLLAGYELFKSSLDKIISGEADTFSLVMIGVLLLSIAVKGFMAVMYHRVGTKIMSNTVLAAGEDSRNDAITTSVVLVSLVLSLIIRINLDGIMGLLVSLFILYSGFKLVNETIKPLLGATPDPEIVAEIEKKIMSYDLVIGTHDLMVHDYGPNHMFASAHVEVSSDIDPLVAHEQIDKIEIDFMRDMRISLVLHYDPIDNSDSTTSEIRQFIDAFVKEIDPRLSIHDLRMVPGVNNTNVIFDIVITHSLKNREKEILHRIREKVRESYPKYTLVIKVDHSYIAVQ